MLLPTLAALLTCAPKTVTADKEWSKQAAAIGASAEADRIVRVGDVDNLGFGWPDDFDPFCGRMSATHEFPWEPKPDDVPGLDRILLSSRFKGGGGDGYSSSFDKKRSKPVPIEIPTASLEGVQIANAFLQIFIDDFQAPSMSSRFQVLLGGRRFAEAERVLNAIDQSGPVGKLVTIPVPEEFHADLGARRPLALAIDEVNGAADGWAIDFVRLLVNRKREGACKGTVRGRIVEKEGEAPIPRARATLADGTSAVSDAEGAFVLEGVPAGFEVIVGSAPGFVDGTAAVDVGKGDENEAVTIALAKGKALLFDKKPIEVGKALNLENVLFDTGKAELKKESSKELEKVVRFMKDNPRAQIELSGHTSSDGDAASNRSLSYRRVKACKDWMVAKGVDPGRIIAVGFGPDRPVAPNDTEANRKLNRRVELRVIAE